MQNFDKYLESLDEGKIVLKRRYTDNHPEKNVRKGANIRNTIIEALRDKKLTLSEFNEIVAQHSKSPNKWTQRNKRFFKIEEDNVRLSRYGNKIAKTIQPVNEGRKEITKKQWDKADDDQREEWLLGAFSDPDDAIEHIEKDWEDLPPQATSNMYESTDINEGREKPFRKVKVGDVGQDYNGEDVTIVAVGKLGKLMKYDDTGMAEDGLSQGYLDKNDDAVAVESPEGGYALVTYGDDGVAFYESINEAKAPKNWDSQFTMNAIEAYKNNEFDLEDDKSIAAWDKKYNGGRAPKPAFNTKEVVSYAIETGKKPNGDKMDESVVNEGVHAKIKKAMKAVEKGETVYGENIRFPGRFKILRFTMGGAMAVIDYEDGTKPYEMAAMNIAIDKMKFESVEINERAKATQMLKHVVKGLTTDVEGIKLSKEMAQAYLDWLQTSPYGRKYDGLPFEMIFKASFNWGIDRYTKSLKKEYKELKQQAKEMKESTIYTDFSNFVNESYIAEEEVNEAFKVGDYIKHTAQRKTVFAKIVKAGKKSASIAILGRGGADDKQPTSRKETWQGGSYVDFGKHSKKELDDIAKTLSPGSGYKYSDMEAWNIQESVELNEMKEPKCSNKEGHLYKKIDKDGTVECVHCGLRNSLSESVEINEALKSSKLRNLLSMKKSPKDLMKAIYGATKIALDKVEDHQVVDVDPKQGPKQDGYVFYYTTQEKENPHAPDSYYNASFPANTLLALAKGKKVFYVKHTWNRRGPNTYSLTTDPKGGYTRSSSATDIGPNKSYSGYDASGLGSLARVISIADAAFVVNPDALETTGNKIEQRAKAKEGAIAFQDPKEFKNANLARYKEILTQRSESLDVDKEVEKAINDIADVMKDGIKNKKQNRYGEVIMGTGQDGRDFKMNDLTNFTTRLMDDYQRWSGHMADVERAKEALKKGDDSGSRRGDDQWEVKYYTKQALEYAKNIKDRLKKLKKKNLAW